MIYCAKTHIEPGALPPEEPTTYLWVSLDDEHYIPVNRAPHANNVLHEKRAILGLLQGDGNFKPMTFARRWLEHESAEFWTVGE
jgi:hypothetical protein